MCAKQGIEWGVTFDGGLNSIRVFLPHLVKLLMCAGKALMLLLHPMGMILHVSLERKCCLLVGCAIEIAKLMRLGLGLVCFGSLILLFLC